MVTCLHYDYIEIACLYRLSIMLTLNSGKTVSGLAQNIVYNKKECLVLQQDAIELTIETSTLKSMQALTANAHFSVINFK
jgi:Rho-binding antiterminator